MKKQKNIKKLLDLQKIDISILNDSDKRLIQGGYNSQGCAPTTDCIPSTVPNQTCGNVTMHYEYGCSSICTYGC